MKKKCILALILGAAFMAQGCGFTEGTDAVVTVVDSTPTPEPTEAPEETATPTPEATAEADSTAAADLLPRQQQPNRHQAELMYRLRMQPIMQ